MLSSSHYTEHRFNLALHPRHQKNLAFRAADSQTAADTSSPACSLSYLSSHLYHLVWLEQRQAASLKWHWQLFAGGRVRLLCGESWGKSVQPVAEGRDAGVSFLPPSAFSSGLPLRITHAHVTLRQQSQTLRLKPRGVYGAPLLSPGVSLIQCQRLAVWLLVRLVKSNYV